MATRAAAELDKVSDFLTVPQNKLPAAMLSPAGVANTHGQTHVQNAPPFHMTAHNGELDSTSVFMLTPTQEAQLRHPNSVQEQCWHIGTYASFPAHYRALPAANAQNDAFCASNALWKYNCGSKYNKEYEEQQAKEQLAWTHSDYFQRTKEIGVEHMTPCYYDVPNNTCIVPGKFDKGACLCPSYIEAGKAPPLMIELTNNHVKALVLWAIRNGIVQGVPPPIDVPILTVPGSLTTALAKANLTRGSLFEVSPQWLIDMIARRNEKEAKRMQQQLAKSAAPAQNATPIAQPEQPAVESESNPQLSFAAKPAPSVNPDQAAPVEPKDPLDEDEKMK